MSKDVLDIIELNRIIATKLIECGDEVNRVEEIINDIIISEGFKEPNVFGISTGLFYSFKDDKQIYTDVIRINKRGTNLKDIIIYTDIANKIINKEITIQNAIENIKNIKSKKHPIIKILSAGLSTGFFSLLYGGNKIDFSIAFICGLVIQMITMTFKRTNIFHFLNSLICSFITTIIAIISIRVLNKGNLNNIVIGSIMLILPGLTLTNSIKDVLMGNLVAGTSRLSEAFFIALAISIGVVIAILLSTKVGVII